MLAASFSFAAVLAAFAISSAALSIAIAKIVKAREMIRPHATVIAPFVTESSSNITVLLFVSAFATAFVLSAPFWYIAIATTSRLLLLMRVGSHYKFQ